MGELVERHLTWLLCKRSQCMACDWLRGEIIRRNQGQQPSRSSPNEKKRNLTMQWARRVPPDLNKTIINKGIISLLRLTEGLMNMFLPFSIRTSWICLLLCPAMFIKVHNLGFTWFFSASDGQLLSKYQLLKVGFPSVSLKTHSQFSQLKIWSTMKL